jgi:hypothetical protein
LIELDQKLNPAEKKRGNYMDDIKDILIKEEIINPTFKVLFISNEPLAKVIKKHIKKKRNSPQRHRVVGAGLVPVLLLW